MTYKIKTDKGKLIWSRWWSVLLVGRLWRCCFHVRFFQRPQGQDTMFNPLFTGSRRIPQQPSPSCYLAVCSSMLLCVTLSLRVPIPLCVFLHFVALSCYSFVWYTQNKTTKWRELFSLYFFLHAWVLTLSIGVFVCVCLLCTKFVNLRQVIIRRNHAWQYADQDCNTYLDPNNNLGHCKRTRRRNSGAQRSFLHPEGYTESPPYLQRTSKTPKQDCVCS